MVKILALAAIIFRRERASALWASGVVSCIIRYLLWKLDGYQVGSYRFRSEILQLADR